MNSNWCPGTADGVMQTDMIIDSQKLTYVNQPPWKASPGPQILRLRVRNLSWISTQAGTRQYTDIPGAWGWIRLLLDKAAVSAYPGVSSSPARFRRHRTVARLITTLRTRKSEGPLALLKA